MISDKPTSLPADILSHAPHTTDQKKQKKRRRPTGLSLANAIAFYEDERGHWTGACDGDKPSYAVIWFKGKLLRVHRVKMEMAGNDLTDKVVMHIDDNPRNVRMDNLRVGTQAENMADMARKGRGRTAPRFKATEIADIVSKHNRGVSINQIVRETGRTRKAIRCLLKRISLKLSQMTTQGLPDFTESPTPV